MRELSWYISVNSKHKVNHYKQADHPGDKCSVIVEFHYLPLPPIYSTLLHHWHSFNHKGQLDWICSVLLFYILNLMVALLATAHSILCLLIATDYHLLPYLCQHDRLLPWPCSLDDFGPWKRLCCCCGSEQSPLKGQCRPCMGRSIQREPV